MASQRMSTLMQPTAASQSREDDGTLRRSSLRTRTLGCAEEALGALVESDHRYSQRRRSSIIGIEAADMRRRSLLGSVCENELVSHKRLSVLSSSSRRPSEIRGSLTAVPEAVANAKARSRESSLDSDSDGSSDDSDDGPPGLHKLKRSLSPRHSHSASSFSHKLGSGSSFLKPTEASRLREELTYKPGVMPHRRCSVLGFEASHFESTSRRGSAIWGTSTPSDSRRSSGLFKSQRTLDIVQMFNHDCLKRIDTFTKCDPAFVELLMDQVQTKVFKQGADICLEGETGTDFFMLINGSADVLIGDCRIAGLSDGSIFGEMAALGETSGVRVATVRAATFCECRMLESGKLQHALKRFPHSRKAFVAEAKRKLADIEKNSLVSLRALPGSLFGMKPGMSFAAAMGPRLSVSGCPSPACASPAIPIARSRSPSGSKASDGRSSGSKASECRSRGGSGSDTNSKDNSAPDESDVFRLFTIKSEATQGENEVEHNEADDEPDKDAGAATEPVSNRDDSAKYGVKLPLEALQKPTPTPQLHDAATPQFQAYEYFVETPQKPDVKPQLRDYSSSSADEYNDSFFNEWTSTSQQTSVALRRPLETSLAEPQHRRPVWQRGCRRQQLPDMRGIVPPHWQAARPGVGPQGVPREVQPQQGKRKRRDQPLEIEASVQSSKGMKSVSVSSSHRPRLFASRIARLTPISKPGALDSTMKASPVVAKRQLRSQYLSGRSRSPSPQPPQVIDPTKELLATTDVRATPVPQRWRELSKGPPSSPSPLAWSRYLVAPGQSPVPMSTRVKKPPDRQLFASEPCDVAVKRPSTTSVNSARESRQMIPVEALVRAISKHPDKSSSDCSLASSTWDALEGD